MHALNTGATGMAAQQLNVDTIANNIANMNTTAYKRQRAEFQDLLYQNLTRVGATSSDAGTVIPSGVQVGTGVKVAATYRITEQGDVNQTGNALDVLIDGPGHFQISLPSGETAYTRAGSFQLNGDGQIVTHDGYVVQPGVTVPDNAKSITINTSGEVIIRVDGQSDLQLVGQFELARFPNDGGLEAIGSNLFLETAASGAAQIDVPAAEGFGALKQGSLETSNVNVVTEITSLISAQRAYEMNSKVITSAGEMLSTLNQVR